MKPPPTLSLPPSWLLMLGSNWGGNVWGFERPEEERRLLECGAAPPDRAAALQPRDGSSLVTGE